MTAELAPNPGARADRPRKQASLAMLMGLVAVIAVGLAAMKIASDLAAQVAILGSIVALLVAMLGARVRRDRAAWVGFSLFGWGYLAILGVPMVVPIVIPNLDTTYVTRLRLDAPIADLAEWLHPEPPEGTLAFTAAKSHAMGEYGRLSGSEIVPFTPAEAQAFANYQSQQAIYDDGVRARSCASWIGLAFQGLAFATFGAFLGHRISDQRTPANGIDPTPLA